MLAKKKPFARKHPQRMRYAIVGIIIIAALVYIAIPKSSVPTFAQLTNVTMSLTGTKSFMLPGDSNVYVFYLKAVGSNSSVLYVARQPMLSNPIMAVSLQLGKPAKISTYNGTSANLEITLLSTGSNSAKFAVLPVSTSLGIGTSGVFYFIQPSMLLNSVIYQNTTNVTIVTTSISSTTTSVTTTASSGNTIPTAQIMQEINNSVFGILMNNYDTLYKKDIVCNQSVYNATFIKFESTKPEGPSDFHNASLNTPTALSSSISYLGGKKYLIIYNSTSPSKRTTGPALMITLNFTSGTVTNSSFTGVYLGLNYSQVYDAYNFQASINNFCGAYIPYVP